PNRGSYAKRKPALMRELAELFPQSSVFNGKTYADEALRMAAPNRVELTDRQREALIEFVEGEVGINTPYKTLIETLTEMTGDTEVSKQIHAEAVRGMEGTREVSTEEQEKRAIRNEHKSEAKKILPNQDV